MQAWLLHIIYGAYMGGAARYGKAKIMLRSLVDVRMSNTDLVCLHANKSVCRLPRTSVFSSKLSRPLCPGYGSKLGRRLHNLAMHKRSTTLG